VVVEVVEVGKMEFEENLEVEMKIEIEIVVVFEFEVVAGVVSNFQKLVFLNYHQTENFLAFLILRDFVQLFVQTNIIN